MEGALDTTCEYAKERQQYGVAIGSFQAVQHLLAEARVLVEGSISVREYAAWAVDALPPEDALEAGSVAKAYCAREPPAPCARPRSRCTAGSATRGSASCTCTCAECCCRARCSATRATTCGALARRRLGVRPWTLTTRPRKQPSGAASGPGWPSTTPACPASSTDDEYWARQAEWHCALFDAGFFALTWPRQYGGHELPPVYEVIVDEELAAAGAPPKPSLGLPHPGNHADTPATRCATASSLR